MVHDVVCGDVWQVLQGILQELPQPIRHALRRRSHHTRSTIMRGLGRRQAGNAPLPMRKRPRSSLPASGWTPVGCACQQILVLNVYVVARFSLHDCSHFPMSCPACNEEQYCNLGAVIYLQCTSHLKQELPRQCVQTEILGPAAVRPKRNPGGLRPCVRIGIYFPGGECRTTRNESSHGRHCVDHA